MRKTPFNKGKRIFPLFGKMFEPVAPLLLRSPVQIAVQRVLPTKTARSMAVSRTARINLRNPLLCNQKILPVRFLGFDLRFGICPFILSSNAERILIAPRTSIIVIGHIQYNRRMIPVFPNQMPAHRGKTIRIFLDCQLLLELPRLRK